MNKQSHDQTNQSHKLQLKRIVWWSVMAATISVLRIVFSGVPNVQPMTVTLIWVTCILGLKDGMVIAILSVLISNIYLGLGVWTLGQMLAYACIVLFSYVCIRPIFQKRFLAAILAGVTGYLFGLIYAIFQASLFGTNFWAYYAAGVLFDTYHALGNSAFYLLLYPIFVPIIQRFSITFFKKGDANERTRENM